MACNGAELDNISCGGGEGFLNERCNFKGSMGRIG